MKIGMYIYNLNDKNFKNKICYFIYNNLFVLVSDLLDGMVIIMLL